MVINNTVEIEALILENLPQVLKDNFGGLIVFIKAVGIVILVYVAYRIVREILTWRRIGRLKRVEMKVNEIDKKLDKVLAEKGKSVKRVKKKKK